MTSEQHEKRMISDTGYEVFQSMRIGGKEILLAENKDAEDGMTYLVCKYKDNGIFAEYSQVVKIDDYLESIEDFTERIGREIVSIRSEHIALGSPSTLFTNEQCHPNNYQESIENKIVAIKADVFSPEYRHGYNQLVYVTGGNGAHANARGNAVYCYSLKNGDHTRFESQAVQPYGTWEGRKDSKSNFEIGHYFNAREDAKTDLQERAAKEQKYLDRHMRDDQDR